MLDEEIKRKEAEIKRKEAELAALYALRADRESSWRVATGEDTRRDDWKVYNEFSGSSVARAIFSEQGDVVAFAVSTDENEIGHAHLIAAAPELLKACESLLAEYKNIADSGDLGDWDAEETTEVRLARSAIAKAKGGVCDARI